MGISQTHLNCLKSEVTIKQVGDTRTNTDEVVGGTGLKRMGHMDRFDWETVTIRARKIREGLQSQRENLKSPRTLGNSERLMGSKHNI